MNAPERQIQRMVKLQKLKDDLAKPRAEAGAGAGAGAGVSVEEWAEAAGETVESLRQALEEGANAKEELGE